MAWPWTRKKKNTQIVNNTPPPPPTPQQEQLLEKLKEEIRNVFVKRNTRRVKFIQNVTKPYNVANQNAWWYKPYENNVILYLVDLLKQLQHDPNPFFFNEAYAEFLQRRNQLNMNAKAKNLTNSVLRKLRVYTRKLTNNNINESPRLRYRTSSFNSFSNAESSNESASLPSLRSLRASIDPNLLTPAGRGRTRRLKGHVVKTNQDRLSPTTV